MDSPMTREQTIEGICEELQEYDAALRQQLNTAQHNSEWHRDYANQLQDEIVAQQAKLFESEQAMRCVAKTVKYLNRQVADTNTHLEAQRAQTYQAVAREHGLKQQLADMTQERDALKAHLEDVQNALGLSPVSSRPLSCFVNDLKAERDALKAIVQTMREVNAHDAKYQAELEQRVADLHDQLAAAKASANDYMQSMNEAHAEAMRDKYLLEEAKKAIAACTAHRSCCSDEHDPAQGKLHGCCVVCGTPWPCETAQQFLTTNPQIERTPNMAEQPQEKTNQETTHRILPGGTQIVEVGDKFFQEVQDADHGWRYRVEVERVER